MLVCFAAGAPRRPVSPEVLPDDVITHVLLLTQKLGTVLNARLSSSSLHGPAAAAVEALVTEGGRLPALALSKFPEAVRLVARPLKQPASGGSPPGRACSSCCTPHLGSHSA
jgi:hypothetical protein